MILTALLVATTFDGVPFSFALQRRGTTSLGFIGETL